MSRNGDQPTGPPPPGGDWRSAAFKLEEVPEPYRTQQLQHGLQELDEDVRNIGGVVEVRIRAWEKSIDRRIAAAVQTAADETGARVFVQIQRELTKVHSRLDAVEQVAELAAGRAERAVDQSGQYRPVVVNVVDNPTPQPPEIPSDPAVPNLSRWEQTKKTAKKPTAVIGVIVAIVYAAVNAWLASKH